MADEPGSPQPGVPPAAGAETDSETEPEATTFWE